MSVKEFKGVAIPDGRRVAVLVSTGEEYEGLLIRVRDDDLVLQRALDTVVIFGDHAVSIRYLDGAS